MNLRENLKRAGVVALSACIVAGTFAGGVTKVKAAPYPVVAEVDELSDEPEVAFKQLIRWMETLDSNSDVDDVDFVGHVILVNEDSYGKELLGKEDHTRLAYNFNRVLKEHGFFYSVSHFELDEDLVKELDAQGKLDLGMSNLKDLEVEDEDKNEVEDTDEDNKEDEKEDEKEDVFTDLKNDWSKNEIESLAKKGLIKGVGKNQFKPNNKITRAEFVTLINRVLGHKELGEVPFKDVAKNKWYYEEIGKIYKSEIVQGVGGGLFKPEAQITREEIGQILGNVLIEKGFEKDGKNYLSSFTDKNKVSSWSQDNLELLVQLGLLKGNKLNQLNPRGQATREEAAVLIYRFNEIINN